MSTLYSIGHGNKTIEEFEEELRSFGIQYLIDVRTKPYSEWNPSFNQNCHAVRQKIFQGRKRGPLFFILHTKTKRSLDCDKKEVERDVNLHRQINTGNTMAA